MTEARAMQNEHDTRPSLFLFWPLGKAGVWTFCGLDLIAHIIAHFIGPSGELMPRHRA
jgi:hypothetical protein